MKSHFRGHNALDIRRRNRGAVLRAILKCAPISRRGLGHLSGLDGATITRITRELIDQHLIREVGSDRSSPQSQPGPREILLAINDNGALAGGVAIGLRSLAVGLVSLRGEIQAERWLEDRGNMSLPDMIDWVRDQLATLAQEAGMALDSLVGVGVGVYGLADPHAGTSLAEVDQVWPGGSPDRPLAAALGVPVLGENNLRAAALAEAWFGAGRDVSDLVLFWVGYRLGCGIIIDHRLHRGHDQLAGHIAHLAGPWPSDAPCRCGHRGCLETAVSALALSRRALAAAMPGSALCRLLDDQPEWTRWQAVVEMANQGDPIARRVVAELARDLGEAVATVAAVLSPQRVVIAGPIVAAAGDRFLEPLRETVRAGRASRALAQLDVVPASWDQRITLVGAATLALQHLLYEPEASGEARFDWANAISGPNGREARRGNGILPS